MLDFGTFVAGSLIGRLLADLGADVIKVESAEGDPLRTVIYAFIAVNRGKRNIVLDLAKQSDRDTIYGLVKGADILIENYRPGVARRLGLDFETLRQLNPRLIAYSGTSWGPDGPLALLPGMDPNAAARMGLMQAQGGIDRPPVYNHITVFDHATALTGTYGVLAALYYRDRTGIGQHVEASMLAVGMAVHAANFIFYDGKFADQDGAPDLVGLAAPHRLYKSASGWLMLVVANREQWLALTAALGRLDLAERYDLARALAEPRDGPLACALEAAFASSNREYWLATLRERGVPAAAALDLAQVYRDPQVAANGLFQLEAYPPWGNLWLTANLAKFSVSSGSQTRRSPGKDEHREEILRELNGGGRTTP